MASSYDWIDIPQFYRESSVYWGDFCADLTAIEEASHMGVLSNEASSFAFSIQDLAQESDKSLLQACDSLFTRLFNDLTSLTKYEIESLHNGSKNTTIETSKEHIALLDNVLAISSEVDSLARNMVPQRQEAINGLIDTVSEETLTDETTECAARVIHKALRVTSKQSQALGAVAKRIKTIADGKCQAFAGTWAPYEMYMGMRLGSKTLKEWKSSLESHWEGYYDSWEDYCTRLEKAPLKKEAAAALNVLSGVTKLRNSIAQDRDAIFAEYQDIARESTNLPEVMQRIEALKERVQMRSANIQSAAIEESRNANKLLKRFPDLLAIKAKAFEVLTQEGQELLQISEALEEFRKMRSESPPLLGR